MSGTKNRAYFCVGRLNQLTEKNYFWCQLFKTVGTKNKSPFLMTIEIISRHHKKVLGVTINHFSTSECWRRVISNI
jgi:hypothetical protein